jgi:hypothetical protein
VHDCLPSLFPHPSQVAVQTPLAVALTAFFTPVADATASIGGKISKAQ